jgi:hypothetical protein
MPPNKLLALTAMLICMVMGQQDPQVTREEINEQVRF